MLNAAWTLDSGRTIELRIVEEPGERVNPFKRWTKRRNNKGGQIFESSIVEIETGLVVYDGGLWLAGWGDGHGGMWVRFWIDELADRHPFASFRRRSADHPIGTLFAVVLVALDDSGNAIDPNKEHLAGAVEAPRKGRTNSQWAHLIITGPRFVQWLREKAEPRITRAVIKHEGGWNPENARRYVVRYVLQAESLTVIDHNEEKLKLFHEKIRIPFSQWAGDD